MKKILFLIVVICNVQAFAQTYPQGLNINDKAPDFTATDQNGQMINLKKQIKKRKCCPCFLSWTMVPLL